MAADRKSREALHDGRTRGEAIADGAASAIGSWRFIIIQTVAVVAWVVGNVYEAFHFDPAPFILLNLMFSVQAAYTGPVLLLAGNRAAQKDRAMAAKDDEEIGLLVETTKKLHDLQVEQMSAHKNELSLLRQLVGRHGAARG
jgi:uncharacterized membrane protein